MIYGRNLLTGLLVYGTGEPICRPCWNGYHHMCLVQADEFNKCTCATWPATKAEHAKGCAERKKSKPPKYVGESNG